MRRLGAIAIGLSFAASLVAAPSSASWPLIWRDEFEGIALDLSHWRAGSLPWGGRHHNDEYASYIMPEDAYLQGGNLVLRSRKGSSNTAFGGFPYSEGFIHTDGKLNYKYGYVEIRAQFPRGKGVWPAFWTLPQGWPPEFDIAEYFGSEDRMHMGLAHGVCCPATWDSGNFTQLGVEAWHTYGLEWGPGYALFMRDGRPMRAIYASYVPAVPMYLILNSGMRWDADASTPFPNYFRVDSVRLFRMPDVVINDVTTGTGLHQFQYNGTWQSIATQSGAFFRDNHWSGKANDSFTVRFNGTRIDLYGARDPSHGIAGLSIDGGPETRIDYYAATREDMALVWSSPAMSPGTHSLTVRVTGTRNAASQGTFIPADRADVWRTPNVLSGTVIGTTGSWNNLGATRDRAFNGTLKDHVDAPVSSGSWCGLDLGAGTLKAVTAVRFCPRAGFASRMVQGIFQGANKPDFSDAVQLHQITSAPYEEVMTEVKAGEVNRFRYVRYLGPTGGFGNVAELEFVGSDLAPFELKALGGVNAIRLTWSAIPGATTYRVRRTDDSDGRVTVVGEVNEPTFVDATARPGLAYEYSVSAFHDAGGINTSASSGAVVTRGVPTLEWSVPEPGGAVVLRWPEWALNLQLQIATNLAPPVSWSPIALPPGAEPTNGFWQQRLSNPPTPSSFLRLGLLP